jgi:hypothetical protein
MPTRDEIQSRRLAIAESVRTARMLFNDSAVVNELALKRLQAECDHPAAARKSEYVGSHFKHRCADCGKLLQ